MHLPARSDNMVSTNVTLHCGTSVILAVAVYCRYAKLPTEKDVNMGMKEVPMHSEYAYRIIKVYKYAVGNKMWDMIVRRKENERC